MLEILYKSIRKDYKPYLKLVYGLQKGYTHFGDCKVLYIAENYSYLIVLFTYIDLFTFPISLAPKPRTLFQNPYLYIQKIFLVTTSL
jgi:hypothetical protein